MHKESPLDNRQKYLDVLCFPNLFPTGRFGECHPRAVKISRSEITKSRLYNVDSRFRKNAQYVFFLLWMKELRELSAGIYNLLRGAPLHVVPVQEVLAKVSNNDKNIEGNLSTIFQSMRGSKQYWFLRSSEVKCMVREWGSPTLFLTFSCAEYESPDITAFLTKINNVPNSYPIGKLCCDDPISVSRKFSLKFHCVFHHAIIKIFGKVSHYFVKKRVPTARSTSLSLSVVDRRGTYYW